MSNTQYPNLGVRLALLVFGKSHVRTESGLQARCVFCTAHKYRGT